MGNEDIRDKIAATLATLETMREILKDERLKNDRKLLCDVWCSTIVFSSTKGCDEDIANLLLAVGKGPLMSPTFNTDECVLLLEETINNTKNIFKDIGREQLIRSMATGEPLFTIDLTNNT